MNLRRLEQKDAPLMLEWMHDPSVVKNLQSHFAAKTLDDCKAFIQAAEDENENLHLAITDDNDEYMGTISLKNIHDGTAEFAITIRKCAMGNGYSRDGMTEIIKRGFDELGLNKIFWCVNPVNQRAVRFYDKYGYQRIDAGLLPIGGAYSLEQVKQYLWYKVDNPNQ